MGIGKIGRPNTVFVRNFRWTLQGTNISEHYMKCVKFDYCKHEIEFECYEIVAGDSEDIEIQQWLENTDFSTEIMTFTTYDGCGISLYEYKFNDLKLLSDTSDFDYANSDASTRKVKIHYESYERKFLAGSPISLTKRIKEELLKQNIAIEDVEVNFLNGKTWITGKRK